MTTPETRQDSRVNENVFRLVSYTLITLMMLCAALTVVNALSILMTPWQPGYIVIICLLVTLDRLYTYREYKTLGLFTPEWISTLVTQSIVILVLAKIVVGLSHGLGGFWAEILLWQQDFATNFFDKEFMIVVMLIILIWVVSGDFAGQLEEIGLDQALIDEDAAGAKKGNLSARERLLNLFFAVGSVLVVCTAMGRLDLRVLFFAKSGSYFIELPALAAGGASTLLYFMLGLALLSQTQLMELHVRWNLQHIPVSRKLAGRWALYSILFLVLMAAVVSLLPTSYSLNPLMLLGYALDIVVLLLAFFARNVLFLLLLLLGWIFSLFGVASPAKNLPAPPLKIPPLPTDVNQALASPAWWEFVKSLAFWVIFLGILLFSAMQYFRQHEEAFQKLRKLPGWLFLERAWQWLRGMFTSARDSVSRAMVAAQKRLQSRAAAGELFARGFLSLRGLDPRQRVAFFYLALVRRGAESGLPRSVAQTPYEYAATLEEALPAADEDIRALTEAFNEARYSRRPVQPEKASLVKTLWERIRKALRERK